MSRKAVFLDRDGTIIKDYGYMFKLEQLEFFPRSIDGLRQLHDAGYLLIVVTNQSGIGRGRFTRTQYDQFAQAFVQKLHEGGVDLDGQYMCPHHPDDHCPCRKPASTMYADASSAFDIDVSKSFCIGDKTEDIFAAEQIGAKSVLVLTGKAGKDGKYKVQPTSAAKDLHEACNMILSGNL